LSCHVFLTGNSLSSFSYQELTSPLFSIPSVYRKRDQNITPAGQGKKDKLVKVGKVSRRISFMLY
jgi:hypothetical protein